MARRRFAFALLYGLFLLSTAATNAAENELHPQSFEWNVFLGDWQILGPFANTGPETNGLKEDFGVDENAVDFGDVVLHHTQEYRWQACDEQVVQFRQQFEPSPTAYRNSIAYATTSFTSPQQQRVILALGADDGVVVWLNGEEVHRDDATSSPSRLDEYEVEVDLKEGTNTLLLKVGQLWGNWECFARLLPVHDKAQEVTINCDVPQGDDLGRLPVVEVNLLDAEKSPVASVRSSGYRLRAGKLGYTLVLPELVQEPTFAQLTHRDPGLAHLNQIVEWEKLREGDVSIPLAANRFFAALLLDAKTKEPIPNAQVWVGGSRTPTIADENGRASLETSPLRRQVWVTAKGYKVRGAKIEWPREELQTITLVQGGKILRGQVLSNEGKPIANARIDAGLSGYDPLAISDSEGRFEIFSIPDGNTSLSPKISHPKFVIKDGFSVELPGELTEVTWNLSPAGVVMGRVVSRNTGRPLPNVSIESGTNRYGNNPKTKTNAEGHFRLPSVRPGENIIHAFSDNFAPAMTTVNVNAESPAEVEFQLDTGLPVTGRVVDPAGAPVDDVWVVVNNWNDLQMFRRDTRTNKKGEFTLPHMPDSPAAVEILKQGFMSQRGFSMKGGDTYEIELSPVIEHTVRVRLAGSDKPLADLQIQKGYQWGENEQIIWQTQDSDTKRNYDRIQGVFRIRESEPTYEAIFYRFRHPGYHDQVIEFPADAKTAQSFDVTLQKAGRIRGRVVAAETGTPLPGVSVALVSKSDKLADTYTMFRHPAVNLEDFTGAQTVSAADGGFELPEPVNPEEYAFVLTRLDDSFAYLPNLDRWLEEETLELPYPEGGAIEGVITVAGKPMANETVHIQWVAPHGNQHYFEYEFGVYGAVETDSEGRYCFTGLGPGRYNVTRMRSFWGINGGGMSMPIKGETMSLKPGETRTLNFEQPAGHHVSGMTVDPQGKPLGDSLVTVTAKTDRLNYREVVRADGQGQFTISHLPSGKFTLSANHYSTTDGQRCGLGGVDYNGSVDLEVPNESNVRISMASALSTGAAGNGSSIVGTVAPELTGTPLDADAPFALSDQWGKVVVLDFWATWCGPCIAAMPTLEKVHDKYQGRDDVVFMTISLDDDEERLREFIRKNALPFPVIYSGAKWDNPIARSFAVASVPSTFVIGRDGRFATDNITASRLSEAISAAIEQPLSLDFESGKTPARLNLQLTLDGEETGFPGAEFHVKVLNAAGELVRQERLPLTGTSREIKWLYPPLESGQIVVTAGGNNMASQTRTLVNPKANETLEFFFDSPRMISGKLAANDGQTLAPRMEVTIRGDGRFQRSAVTDKNGEFQIKVIPGSYSLTISGNDRFAALPHYNTSVSVPSDADPKPLSIAVATATTITGTVADTQSRPVSGVKVIGTGTEDSCETNSQGEFELSGLSNLGTSTIYAIHDGMSGVVTISGEELNQPVRLVLGEGLQSGRVVGKTLPELSLVSLDGSAHIWKASSDQQRLLVIGRLGTAPGRALITRAQQWCMSNDAQLEVISVDWYPEQAQRAQAQHNIAGVIWYGGPNGSNLPEEWKINPQGTVYLVSKEGRVTSSFASGTLPD